MPTPFDELLADLATETASVRRDLAGLADEDWQRSTPAAGWTIGDQVSHLAYFDDVTALSVTDAERFRGEATVTMARGADFADEISHDYQHLTPAELKDWWDRARTHLLAVYAQTDPRRRLPWYGPDMSAMSSATARLMETWAHGVDIADTIGRPLPTTNRLRHIAHLGIRTTAFSFSLRQLEVPAEPIRVELIGPEGAVWTWGPADGADKVQGSALDFCLVVTQRRHLDDTALQISGEAATAWMAVAQAFAGPPSPGRSPRSGVEAGGR